MNPTTFEKGALVYSLDGHAGRYQAAVPGAGHLVAPIWEAVRGDEVYEEEGEPTLWKQVFETEPEPKLGPQIIAQQKQLDEINGKLNEARTSLHEASRLARENVALQSKLAGQNLVFKRADLLFEDKINFVVSYDWYGRVQVIPRNSRFAVSQGEHLGDKQADFSQEPLRLLSLWGKRDGVHGWHLHSYSDGSGNGGHPVEVFETQEEAVEFAKTKILELIAKKRRASGSDPSRAADRGHWDSLKAIGLGDLYPQDLRDYLATSTKRRKDEEFLRLEKQYLAAKAAREAKHQPTPP